MLGKNKAKGISGVCVCAMQVVVNASSAGHPVASSMGFVGQGFTLPVPQAHLWSFDDPFLYDLDVILLASTSKDAVQVKTVSMMVHALIILVVVLQNTISLLFFWQQGVAAPSKVSHDLIMMMQHATDTNYR